MQTRIAEVDLDLLVEIVILVRLPPGANRARTDSPKAAISALRSMSAGGGPTIVSYAITVPDSRASMNACGI